MKIKISKIISAVVSCVVVSTLLIPQGTMNANAIWCAKDGFDKSRYSLTGNMAEDVATIAKSQKGRFCDDFGYSGVDWGAWCDEYVADCLENAGCDSSVVGHGGTVADFARVMRGKGAVEVSSPQTGDLAFFNWSHVEIVTKVVNGQVYTAGGNNRDPNTNTYHDGGCCAGEHSSTGNISYYLRPKYNSLPIVAPTVRTNKSSYVPGADIDINWDYITGATGYWIDIYKDGEGIVSSNLGNVNSYTLKKADNAEYGVFVTAFKDDGNWQSACSECCRFSVKDINAPIVYTNHEYYAPNAEVDIMWDLVDGATGYWIDIYQDGEPVLSQHLNDANCSKYTYQCTKGKYGVFITAFSENGGWSSACSNCHNFYVQDVEVPKPMTDSNCYTPDSDVEVKWDKVDSASGYWMDIWKDGEHISTENIGNVLSYTIPDVKNGKYSIIVTSYNDRGGWTNAIAEAVDFYVKERPSKPVLKASENGSSVVLEWNKCDNTDFYGVRINNSEDGSSYLYKEPYEGNNYSTSLPPGKYFANIASVQKNGFYTFSDDVYFEIESSTIEGDCNNDGEFNVSDVVLLQKWLLAVPDTHFANWKAADMCEDDKLDVFDLCLMKRQLINNNDSR